MRSIAAPILILAAGTLGINELLLKAQARGLPLSSKVGTRFSANGDDLVLAMQLATPVNAVATWRRLGGSQRVDAASMMNAPSHPFNSCRPAQDPRA